LADNGVQKVLKYVATEVCTHITAIPTDQCAPLLDYYFPIAMKKIETYLADPVQACTTLSVCRSSNRWQDILMNKMAHKMPLKKFLSNNGHHHVLKVFNTLPSLQTKSGTDAGCLACTISITTAIAILNQPAITKQVSNGLTELICVKIMPSDISPSCNAFLWEYLPAVLEMTFNEWTPDQICTKLKACTSSSLQSFKSLTLQQQATSACDACQTVTNFLISEFQQPNFQQDVLSLVKSLVCAHSGTTEAQLKCDSYVDSFGPYILVDSVPIWLSNLCPFLHLCPAA